MSPFNLGHAANVIARALIPIFGVVFLGWSGPKLLVVYFADTLASMYCLMVLVMYAGLPKEPEYQAWIKDGLTLSKRLRTDVGVAILPLPFLLLIGFFFGVLPLFVMLDVQQVRWGELLRDHDMWIGVACQFAGAVTLLLNQLDWVRTLDEPKRFFRFQFGLLSLRWGAMILIGFFLAPYIPLIIYGPLLIATYAAMTAALELAPSRMLDMVEHVLGRLNDRGSLGAAAATAAAASRRSQLHPSVAAKPSHRSTPSAGAAPMPIVTQTSSGTRLPSWLILFIAGACLLIGAAGLWGALDFTFQSVPATGKVIEHHATGSRSASIIAQVEVTAAGARSFRTEVEDSFGAGAWVDGGTVALACTKVGMDYPNCMVDSLLDRWLWPLVFFGIGAIVVFFHVRKRMTAG